jgi:hypothetical protein
MNVTDEELCLALCRAARFAALVCGLSIDAQMDGRAESLCKLLYGDASCKLIPLR